MKRIFLMLAMATVAGCGASPVDPAVAELGPEAVISRNQPAGGAFTLPSCKGVHTRGRVVLVPLPGGDLRVEDDGVPVCVDSAQGVIAAGILEDEAKLAAALSGPGAHPRISYGSPGNSDPMPADGEHDGVDGTGVGTGSGGGGGTTSSDPMPATGK